MLLRSETLIPVRRCRFEKTRSAAVLDLPAGRRYLAKEMSALRQVPPMELLQSELPAGLVRQNAWTTAHPGDTAGQPPLRAYYDALFAAYGPQNWWPGRTRFEVIVGAILTQNTSWTNAAKAITNLRREKLLTLSGMETVSGARLASLIRSSGYFRQKAKKLKAFVRFVRAEYNGSLNRMFRVPTSVLRNQLLAVHGIGPETADCILLYAGKHPVFVVDAYTRRILERHGVIHPKSSYEEIRQSFERSLGPDGRLYNEFHALIVHAGKTHCVAGHPRCDECALKPLLPIPGNRS
jgi:endonuclease-3 related protein